MSNFKAQMPNKCQNQNAKIFDFKSFDIDLNFGF